MSNETTALTKIERIEYSREQIDLIKRTFAQGSTDDEFQLFVMTAQRLGLRPEARQIHMVKRPAYDPDTREYVQKMSIQTGIDGYRLIADRTERYAPGREPTFVYNADNLLVSATSYVKKFVRGEWHEVAATAHFDEYAQKKKDGQPTQMWATKPHIMLAKCAEALALRRAFPAELSGVYTDEEMAQADNVPPVIVKPATIKAAPQAETPIGFIVSGAGTGNTEAQPMRTPVAIINSVELNRNDKDALRKLYTEAKAVAAAHGVTPNDKPGADNAAEWIISLMNYVNTPVLTEPAPARSEVIEAA
jgi:phage recombination protein Bet